MYPRTAAWYAAESPLKLRAHAHTESDCIPSAYPCARAGGIERPIPTLQAVSQTEQQLAAMGLVTSFDPTLPKGGGTGGGARGGHRGSSGDGQHANSAAPAPAPTMDTSDIRGLLNRVPPPNTTVQVCAAAVSLTTVFVRCCPRLGEGGSCG